MPLQRMVSEGQDGRRRARDVELARFGKQRSSLRDDDDHGSSDEKSHPKGGSHLEALTCEERVQAVGGGMSLEVRMTGREEEDG